MTITRLLPADTVHDAGGDVRDARSVSLDTTDGSYLHIWLAPRGQALSVLRLYIATIGLTYLPLAAAAAISDIPLAHQAGLLRLPFFYDWNIAYMFFVSFPALVILTVTDQAVLDTALRRVQSDGVLAVIEHDGTQLVNKWAARFRLVNLTSKKFLTAYVIPILGAMGYPLVQKMIDQLAAWLG